MKQFARLDRLPPYVFAEVNELKMELRHKGEDIIDLGMGNPDLPTPQPIIDKLVEAVANRFLASPDISGHEHREPEQSINFVTCHDGFTLNDLVSYNRKHNEANKEGNRDGHDHNVSWNFGVEGPTDDPEIERLRLRQIKNFFTINLLALGVPMLLMGDEVRRTGDLLSVPVGDAMIGRVVDPLGRPLDGQGAIENDGFARGATDYHELLDDDSVDIVYVATRHDMHYPIAKAAVEAGKAVFVEKPITMTTAEARDLVEVVAQHKALLTVGFNRRFSPHTQRLKELLGPIAAPRTLLYRVNAGALPPEHWLGDPVEGGGRLLGEGVHFFDLLRFLAGAGGRDEQEQGEQPPHRSENLLVSDQCRYHN